MANSSSPHATTSLISGGPQQEALREEVMENPLQQVGLSGLEVGLHEPKDTLIYL